MRRHQARLFARVRPPSATRGKNLVVVVGNINGSQWVLTIFASKNVVGGGGGRRADEERSMTITYA